MGGNPQLNTIDMLSLMQFHQLLSLNFMNLAPPLIFGAAAAAQQANTGAEAAITPNLTRPTTSMSSVSSNASDIASNANPIAAAQKAQLLHNQAAAAQQVSAQIKRVQLWCPETGCQRHRTGTEANQKQKVLTLITIALCVSLLPRSRTTRSVPAPESPTSN